MNRRAFLTGIPVVAPAVALLSTNSSERHWSEVDIPAVAKAVTTAFDPCGRGILFYWGDGPVYIANNRYEGMRRLPMETLSNVLLVAVSVQSGSTDLWEDFGPEALNEIDGDIVEYGVNNLGWVVWDGN